MNNITIWLVKNILWVLIYLWDKTIRYEFHHHEESQGLKTYVLTGWHQDIFSLMCSMGKLRRHSVMASKSKDGDIAVYLAHKFNFGTVRGSSRKGKRDKGGSQALEQMVHLLKQGQTMSLTIDGPKGPAFKCKRGAVLMASKSGSPIVPIKAFPESYFKFNSWDSMKVPKPFSTCHMVFGEIFNIPENIEEDKVKEYQSLIENKMNQISLEKK